ncbi:DEKNAAC105584 [Brettanomyces naardenensis]|uniref:DEKNAAC105584 n=1 Tax=Brettanomyces naardenensis TaxID=13370 RepID=A0A448YTL5_BRENA|nr:DEKNAAC105584 [Brettanomyces naardenensis]
MPQALPAPTLFPTKEQFANPIRYMSSPEIIALGEQYGVLKVKPPSGWRPKFALDKKTFNFHTRFQNLRELSLVNRSRDFFFQGFNNYLKMKGMTPLRSSKNKRRGRKRKHPGEEPTDFDGFVTLADGRRTHIYDIFIENDFAKYSGLVRHRDLIENLVRYSNYLQKRMSRNSASGVVTNDSLVKVLHEDVEGILNTSSNSCVICHLNDDPSRTLICDGCERNFHMSCLDPPLRSIPKNEWFCDDCLDGTTGDYGFEEDYDTIFTMEEFEDDCDSFMEDYCSKNMNGNMSPSVDELETEFWKIVEGKKGEIEVRYGADIHNEEKDQISGFPMSDNPLVDNELEKEYIEHAFNLTQLPFAKGSLLNYIKTEDRDQISGMTVPWLYAGSLFSTFCWHKEDHYTMSANYCHLGSTKKWYAIPASDCRKFESLCKEMSPDYFKKQPDLLHQLITLLSPKEIRDEENSRGIEDHIHIYSADQEPNEFVITFPMVYHAGFNCGFNMNEAVNFTMPYWLRYGERAIIEYKKVGKENVFNHYKLLRNIMDNSEFYDYFTPDEVNEMLSRSFKTYSERVNRFSEVMNDEKLSLLLSKLPRRSHREYLEEKRRTLTEEVATNKRGRRRRNTARAEEEDQSEDPDEYICHDCKSFVDFQWVEVDLLKKIVLTDDENEQLPTPNRSPEQKKSKPEDVEWQELIKKVQEQEKLNSEGKRIERRLREHKGLSEPDHFGFEEGLARQQQRRMKVLHRMRHKRAKHANYGKMVLCLYCLEKELTHLNEDEVDELVASTILYDDCNLGELRRHIYGELKPMIERRVCEGAAASKLESS